MGFIGAWRNLAPMSTKLIAVPLHPVSYSTSLLLCSCNWRQFISSCTARQVIPQENKVSNARKFLFASSVKRDHPIVTTSGNENSGHYGSMSNDELSDVTMETKDIAAIVKMIQLIDKQIEKQIETVDNSLDKYDDIMSGLESAHKRVKKSLALCHVKYNDITSDLESARDTIEKLQSLISQSTPLCSRKAELINHLYQLTQRPAKGIAAVGEKSTVLLNLSEESIESLECELVSEISGTTVRGSVERKGNDQYEISYQPTIKGRHQLHIKVNNQPIRGSPFTVRVKLPIKKLGTPILTIAELNKPRGVAVNQRGEVVITEKGKDCVSIFSPRGEKLQSFGTCGSSEGEFDNPCGVAVDNKGNILVVDHQCRIQKFTSDGQFLSRSQIGFHPELEGIAFNPSNNKVYVTDSEGKSVLILNSDLSLSGHIPYYSFKYPGGIACDSTGMVYVADRYNNCILVFTAEGDKVRMFDEKVDHPTGVAVDTSGVVYVTSETYVSMFTSEGRYLASFSKGESEFRYSAVDGSGVLYVCDAKNNVVQLF